MTTNTSWQLKIAETEEKLEELQKQPLTLKLKKEMDLLRYRIETYGNYATKSEKFITTSRRAVLELTQCQQANY